jgi:2-octaprenylphenol hydroxylase
MSASGAADRWDVLIVGGGPVGACAAALLQRALGNVPRPLRIAVLEPNRPQPVAADLPLEARVSALSRASEHILAAADAWKLIPRQRLSPYERMSVWPKGVPARSPRALTFDAACAGEPNLGYIAENRVVQWAALAAFEAAGGTIVPAVFCRSRIAADHVEVETGAGSLTCALIVGADGACSKVRECAGLVAHAGSYRQTAIVANVHTTLAHERTAWQRFLGTGTLAFLPLADGSSSIVWSADEQLAALLLAMPQERFEEELLRASDGVLGTVKVCTARVALPLRRMAAERFTANRCALIGDAAHVVHPLAGQGVNLGLLDAATLAQCLCDAHRLGEDAGAPGPLRRYERWRKSEIAPMALAIDAFNRFLAHGAGPLSGLARRGLSWVNRSEEVKRFFITRALGLAGELPAAARAPAALS